VDWLLRVDGLGVGFLSYMFGGLCVWVSILEGAVSG
jgi:hypothetical protein